MSEGGREGEGGGYFTKRNIYCIWLLGNAFVFISAVPSEPHPSPYDQPDTLTDLQNEALYLAKTDLSDLHVIGQGLLSNLDARFI